MRRGRDKLARVLTASRMGQITVSIAGRQYRMACDDGEEGHLEGLASRLDRKIEELRSHFGEIGDQRITVMAALTIADDLAQAEKRLSGLQAELDQARGASSEVEGAVEAVAEAASSAIREAARRIERIARGLDGGPRS